MGRLICILTILLLHISCKTTQKVIKFSIFKEGIIVFERKSEVSDDAKIQVEKLFDELINKTNADSNKIEATKSEILVFKQMVLADMFEMKKLELVVKVRNDTIWRYEKQGTEYSLLFLNNSA